MTKEEAWKIIESCKGWNTCAGGFTPDEQEVFDSRRVALARAWKVVGEIEPEI